MCSPMVRAPTHGYAATCEAEPLRHDAPGAARCAQPRPAAVRLWLYRARGRRLRCLHVHDVEAEGMKILVAGQLVAYEVGPARDGRSKAVNLRLLTPER